MASDVPCSISLRYFAPIAAADLDAAWAILRMERGAVVRLEARRLGDLRRWYAEGRIGKWKGDDQDLCVPISLNEETANPNL